MNSEAMVKKQAKGINWNTAIFMGLFHIGVGGILCFTGGAAS